MQERSEAISRVTANIERVMVGKRREVQYVLAALLCQGHILLEDVPGVGKTTLVRALARSLGCEFRRIQFTPDLLPSDVIGVSVWNQKTNEFEFRTGPVFAQILLADEINRTSPKTQSALLECMEEGQVTVDGLSLPLPRPFLVLATQNPIEYEGTFPLPEAQLDRFLLKLRIGYPSPAEEREILHRAKTGLLETIGPVIDEAEVIALQEAARNVWVDPSLEGYMISLTGATREHPSIYLGASPRGTLSLYRAAQAIALIRGRQYVTPDDVKEMAPLTLAHRLILRPEAQMRGATAESLIADLLAAVPVPVDAKSYAAPTA
ncbi:MAG TPA: MoxR family ATPase [Symbiobacteriaceae bacterium]|nr:MoxR family ATPase [Symbiobacteriaceae bacterium]